MKTLVVAPSWIGDTLIAQPLLMRLAEQGAQIDVLAPGWSSPLFARMPEVRRVIESPYKHGDFAFFARRAQGKSLAAEGYEQAIVLPNSWKSALVPFFAGIPRRIGYKGEARRGLLNQIHHLDKAAMPQLAQRYAALAQPPGTPLREPLPQPRLTSTSQQQRATRVALQLPTEVQPFIFCPGAEYGPAKRWPARHFAELARRLATEETPVWLLGSEKDTATGDEIAALAGCRHVVNLCGRTRLDQAIDLLAGASWVISNDSGLMHVAAALDRPLIALYGSSSPGYTPPLSNHAKILSLNLECGPCFKRDCPLPADKLRCLEDLSPKQVLAAMNSVRL
ncbi:MAG TPA: lipopolysaccharide heptosyltransferase II [Rhodocyclaceae bacterium]|nr:lipopolysaccharide heptosyltransferase II [Rhodocyclaceae bacterium]